MIRNPRRPSPATLLLFLATLLAAPAFAQPPEPVSPTLPSHAAEPSAFVPPGWTLEQQKTVDLNHDRRPDALLLLRSTEPSGAPRRILAAALRQKNGYTLADSNSRLIPPPAPNQEDPMADGELTTQPGGFSLKLTFISGAGSYGMSTLRFRFRYQPGCLRLIGYDRMETNRNTLDTRDLSVNFLTAAVLHSTGNAQSANPPQQTRDTLHSNPRLCLRDLPSATDFNPQ